MAGIKGNKTHSNKTSFPNQKNWANKKPYKLVYRRFAEMLKNAETNDEILCLQDAYKSINWRYSKVDYWINKIPSLGKYKKDIQSAIISRINKKALQGEKSGGFNATASIWRMKQLGEIDQSNIDHTTKGEKMASDLSILSTDELVKRAEAISKIDEQT